jgi:hypothetical protein
VIYFSGSLKRVPDGVLQLNGRDIPFANNVTYLGVTFDRMTWRSHIERTVGEVLRNYKRASSVFKSGRLSINIKLTLFKALISLVMTRLPHLFKCSAYRTKYSVLLETLTGAHQSANCMWISKFLTCMTT